MKNLLPWVALRSIENSKQHCSLDHSRPKALCDTTVTIFHKWMLFQVAKGLEDNPKLAEDLAWSHLRIKPGELALVTKV